MAGHAKFKAKQKANLPETDHAPTTVGLHVGIDQIDTQCSIDEVIVLGKSLDGDRAQGF